jgi:hypothetical protein
MKNWTACLRLSARATRGFFDTVEARSRLHRLRMTPFHGVWFAWNRLSVAGIERCADSGPSIDVPAVALALCRLELTAGTTNRFSQRFIPQPTTIAPGGAG